MEYTRRELLVGIGLTGIAPMLPPVVKATADGCPFRLAVINDEITPDFEKACQIVSGSAGSASECFPVVQN
jgi:predicted trehalose synthase